MRIKTFNHLIALGLLAVFFGALDLWGALPTSSISIKPIKKKQNKNSSFEFEAGFELNSYLYAEDLYPDRPRSFPSFYGNFLANHSSSGFAANLDLTLGVLMQSEVESSKTAAPFIEFKEAYLQGKWNTGFGKLALSGGRKKERWSLLDDYWGLGVAQPRWRWDRLDPAPIGLTGGFLDLQFNESLKVTAFVTPIFGLERGIPIEAEAGSIVSVDPFFNSPAQDVFIFNQPTTVNYDVSIPSIGSILLNPGAGAMIELGKTQGLWASVSYLYKPVNQLLFSYDGFYSLASQTAELTITPFVAYHHLATFNLGWNQKQFSAWISGLFENPEIDTTQSLDETATRQDISQAKAVSGVVTLRLNPEYKQNLDFGLLFQSGGNASDIGRYATGSGSVFEYRYPFEQALALGGKTNFYNFKNGALGASSRFTFDLGNRGSLWNSSIFLNFNKGLRLKASLAVLSSSIPIDDPLVMDSFISRYRTHDRVGFEVGYAF